MVPTIMHNRDKSPRRDFFKPGDVVNFELDTERRNYRYKDGVDSGQSGEFLNGVVQSKDQNRIEFAAVMPDKKLRYFSVPNYSHDKYELEQWKKEGFVRKWKLEHLDISCECGYGNESNLHFFFCPRHPKQDGIKTKQELKERLQDIKWYASFEVEEAINKLALES